MNKILFLNYNDNPLKTPSLYVDLLSRKNFLYISSFKTKDKIKNNNVKTFGITDYKIPRSFRIILNLIFFKDKKNVEFIFSSHREAFLGVLNVIFAKIYGKKSIVRFGGNMLNMYKYMPNIFSKLVVYFFFAISIRILRYADKIIVMSESFKQELVKKGFKKNKIHVIMQPIDSSKYKVEKKIDLKLDKKKKNLLIVGNLSKFKRTDHVLKLLEYDFIRRNYNFIFAGKDLQGYTKELKKYENVKLLGHVNKNELFNYYSQVDAMLFLGVSEGFPKVLTEAHIFGCPIISKNISDSNRLADRVFDEFEELVDILKNFDLRRKNKRNKVPKEFSHEEVKKKYTLLVESLK